MPPNSGKRTTRAERQIEDQPPGKRTRLATQVQLQQRQAMYRGQVIRRVTRVLDSDRNAWGRTVRIADGTVFYGAIRDHRRQGVVALVTARMIASRTGSAASVPISGETIGAARGHLLAKVFGGDGGDVRNLVPLAHDFSNLQQYQQIEKNVLHHVLRHQTRAQRTLLGRITLDQARSAVNDVIYRALHARGYYHVVRYDVTPRYGISDIYPEYLHFVAQCQTCGQWVQDATVIANTLS